MPSLIDCFNKEWGDIEDDTIIAKVKNFLQGFDDFNIDEAYQSKLIELLVLYYRHNHNYLEERKDKEIKKDIKVIQNFLNLLDENLVTTFRPFASKHTIEFCKQLIDDLETKTFEFNQKYTKFDIAKNPIKKFFDDMPKELKPKTLDIKYFIDSLKPNSV